MNELGGSTEVIAGTGSNDTAASIALTKAAEKAGVDGIMLVTPITINLHRKVCTNILKRLRKIPVCRSCCTMYPAAPMSIYSLKQ